MADTERDYIEKCKRKIEESLNWLPDSQPKQRDFEFLLDLIEQKSKIRLSLSTIKRIWSKENYILPQIATLNALANFLDFADWTDFKKNHLLIEKVHGDNNFTKSRYFKFILIPFILTLLILIGLTLYFFPIKNANPLLENISISFDYPKSKKFPQKVILKYKIRDTSLTDYYIQPYFNQAVTLKLKNNETKVEIPYYFPSNYFIKLISNSNIINTIPITLASDGWMAVIFNQFLEDLYLNKEDLKNKEILSPSKETFEKYKSQIDSLFYMGVYFVGGLKPIDGDNFIFETKVRCRKGSVFQPTNTKIGFRYENFNGSFPLIYEKDISTAECIFEKMVLKNTNNSMRLLICDINEWQALRYEVKDRKFRIYINNTLRFEYEYFTPAGKLLGFNFLFPGLGEIDYIKLYDLNKTMVYENEF